MAPLQSLDTKIEDVPQNQTPIQQFYSKKTVFLTGGTGFFGKIIMEKLLRVTDVEHFYLLVRIKKGKDVYTRMDEMFDDPIFEKVKQDNPKFRHKVSVVNGDCCQPSLGISPEEQALLKQNVNIVIHAAATVRFDEKLKVALAINVAGTKEIINLCKDMTNLKAVVHISTAFAHCNYRHIEEKYYKMKISGENSCRIGEYLDEKTLDNITSEIIKDFPNTYTYTKALAEDVVQTLGKGLPISIFRPAIVITTYKEPIEGWIDNMYGPCGIIVGVAAGILRVYRARVDYNAHIVPVDLAVNAVLASAWDVANNTYEEPPIFNFVPDPENPITWQEYIEYGKTYGETIPVTRAIWLPILTTTPSTFLFNILAFLYHTIPAFFMDCGLVLVGKKARMMNIYKKVHKFINVMAYFGNNSWSFTNKNTRQLWLKLSKEDQKLFEFDMRNVDWKQLFRLSLYGLRTYVVKDDPSTIPAAVKWHQKLKVIHYSFLCIIYSLVISLVYSLLSRLIFT